MWDSHITSAKRGKSGFEDTWEASLLHDWLAGSKPGSTVTNLKCSCALGVQLKEFPEGTTLESMRRAVGRFGITGKSQTQPILQLSDGLRSRLVFAWLAYKTPHILALVGPHLCM